MRRALILGGTGLIGRATARRLARSGWQVDVTGRDPAHVPADLTAAGVRFTAMERDDEAALRSTLGDDADLLVDCLCYSAAQARMLLTLARQVGSMVVLSSKAVYVDDDRRHSNTPGGPEFDGPVRETQPTMAPRTDLPVEHHTGYGANKSAAERILLASDLPVTLLRASKVHGEGARPAREWVFVKRILDHRPHVLLARRGEGVDHPSAATNIAALVETVADQPGRRVLNAADPDAPNVLAIARAVARHLGHEWREVLLEPGEKPELGRTPWDRQHPIVLDMTAATELGYRPVGDYAATIGDEIDWLTSIAQPGPDGVELPAELDDGFFDGRFSYDAEDRYLATR
jgi:nucleoside-diphosphate-sugar epimerase